MKEILPDRTDPLNIAVTLPEVDEEMITDDVVKVNSITCVVEESDLTCPEEEMLDLTITDEFTEEESVG